MSLSFLIYPVGNAQKFPTKFWNMQQLAVIPKSNAWDGKDAILFLIH